MERPPAEVGERQLCDARVVGDQVALGQTDGREERLVGIRDRNFVTADAHWERVS
jgi:hypothetical protein